MNSENNKVFFIISNEWYLNSLIKYSLSKNKGTINFTEVLKLNDNKELNFTTYVYCFEIDEKHLKKKKNEDFYEAKINLNYNKFNFEEIIKFKKGKNTFISDFRFHFDKKNQISAPKFITYSKIEQFELYKYSLKQLNIENNEKIRKDLIDDLLGFLNEILNFDYYLEVFKCFISQEEILLLLKSFNVSRIKYYPNMKIKEYSSILDLIEKDHDVILCHCNQSDKKEEYLEKFNTLLLFFYLKLKEEKKIKELLKKKELKNTFLKVINSWILYGNVIDIKFKLTDQFIFEVLKRNYISKYDYNNIFLELISLI